ncbi:hypothetical protein AOQ84DRAFT_356728 [Glonium stellatum]|uniref:Uncharacterized protein n=1 Tax=Glonium stellatum TaxID=574774 RepID=A0A8E2JNP9_9PEZI|nr:hypothetical protein AOQ84DRAFT_356728 [Glonium stellatum]
MACDGPQWPAMACHYLLFTMYILTIAAHQQPSTAPSTAISSHRQAIKQVAVSKPLSPRMPSRQDPRLHTRLPALKQKTYASFLSKKRPTPALTPPCPPASIRERRYTHPYARSGLLGVHHPHLLDFSLNAPNRCASMIPYDPASLPRLAN